MEVAIRRRSTELRFLGHFCTYGVNNKDYFVITMMKAKCWLVSLHIMSFGGWVNFWGMGVKISHSLVSIRSHQPKPLSHLMKFTQGRAVFCFYIKLKNLDDRLRWYFKLEMFMKVQVSLIWKKKKLIRKIVGFEPDPNGPVYYATLTTRSLRICWMEVK